MLPIRRRTPGSCPVPKWRNWQTRVVQVHVLARVWGFESLLRHHRNHFSPTQSARIFPGFLVSARGFRGVKILLLRTDPCLVLFSRKVMSGPLYARAQSGRKGRTKTKIPGACLPEIGRAHV